MNLRLEIEKQELLIEPTGHPITNAIARNGAFCSYCGQVRTNWTMDHVIPRSKGGRTEGNTVLCCNTCNNDKANMSLLEWLLSSVGNPYNYWPHRVIERNRVAREVERIRIENERELKDAHRQSVWGKLAETI